MTAWKNESLLMWFMVFQIRTFLSDTPAEESVVHVLPNRTASDIWRAGSVSRRSSIYERLPRLPSSHSVCHRVVEVLSGLAEAVLG